MLGGIYGWPPQNVDEFGVPIVDRMMGQALVEKKLLEGTYEDFPAPPLEIAEEERNRSQQEKHCIGVASIGTRSPKLEPRTMEALLPHEYVQEVFPRIHVLGTGTVGRFVAHALAGIGDPPLITLLSRRKDLIRQWHDEGRMLEVIVGGTSIFRSGIDVRHIPMTEGQANPSEQVIDKLIVTTGATATIPALLAIKDQLLPSSTICFLQNGMGIMESVNDMVFPNHATRPRYMIGMITHSLGDQCGRTFTTVHNRPGNTYLSLVSSDAGVSYSSTSRGGEKVDQRLIQRMYYGWNLSSRSLMRSLTRCQILKAKGLQYDGMFQLQLERLAVNSILSPLSVVFDCANGKLLEKFIITKLMRDLLREIVAVVQNLPELQNTSGFKDRFTIKRLECLVIQRASRSTSNISSMLQDARRGRRTEIDFINGYIVKRGLELGIPCPVNAAVIQIVKAKQVMSRMTEASYIPFQDR